MCSNLVLGLCHQVTLTLLCLEASGDFLPLTCQSSSPNSERRDGRRWRARLDTPSVSLCGTFGHQDTESEIDFNSFKKYVNFSAL